MNLKSLLAAASLVPVFSALAGATARLETLSLKTYPFSDPEPMPATDTRRYPYCRFDRTSPDWVMRDWRAVILENAEVKVTILPEVGGKVWAATDKVAGADFLYCNHVMKFRDIAQRGPWLSGGIEFNFGTIGHAPSSSTPVDWYVATNADESVSCFVSAREYATRTVWQVEIRLGANARSFETRTTWFNGSGLPEPLYHWMNAAYSVRDDPEFRFPGETLIGHSGLVHTERWPLDDEGREISDYSKNAFGGAKSYHLLPGNNGFYGIWWPSRKFGSYHRNQSYAKYGRKIWLWPLSRAGGIWEDLLTDDDGQYTELQSGLCFNQPQSESARSPFKHPTFAPGATMAFTETWGGIRDLKEIMNDLATRSPVPRPIRAPEDFDWESAYGRYVFGVQCLRERRDGEGAKALREAIALDGNLACAYDALAGYELRRGNYGEVHHLASKALAIDAYDAEANYFDGFAAFAEGDQVTARDRLGIAALSPEFRSAAYALIARSYLREKTTSPSPALAAAEQSLAANAANRDAILAKLIALRGTPEAAKYAKEVLARFPLMHAARYELRLAGGEWQFDRFLACELPAEEFKELGSWYEESGLYEDAKFLFGRAGNDLMAKLLLGDYAAAKKLPVAGVAPFRREELAALERAVEKDGHWKFRYLLAVLKAYFNYEADSLLSSCGNEPDEAVFYRYRASRLTGDEQLADLYRAARLENSWRIGRELYDHFAAAEDWKTALKVTTCYLKRFPDCNPLQIAHATALNGEGRYAETMAFLKDIEILPSENGDSATAVWQEAQSALGLRLSWPENLGRGKPYGETPELTVGVVSGETKFDVKKPVIDAYEAKLQIAHGKDARLQVLVTCQESELKNVKVEVSSLSRDHSWYAPWGIASISKAFVAVDLIGQEQFQANEEFWFSAKVRDSQDVAELARGAVQGFWLRLHCPGYQAPGVYRGTLTVSADGVDSVELPFKVTVGE